MKKKIKALEVEISSLNELLNAYKENDEKYRQLFEKESDSVVVFDAETYLIEEVNAAAKTLFGFSEKEFLNLSALRIFSKNEETIQKIHEVTQGCLTQNHVIFQHFVKKDESVFPGAMYAGSFVLKGREKIFGAIRDTTDKQQMAEKLRESQEQLFQAQKMEALGTLVAGVAHEINNPINLIMYNTPLVRRIWQDFKPVLKDAARKNPRKKYGGLTYAFLDQHLDQMISDMDLAAKRVETIVGRLKDFARKSSVFDKADMSIYDAVHNSLRLAQSTLKKSNVEVRLRLAENIPLIKGHLQSIEQVILNLIINAIEAIDHDHGIISINADYDQQSQNIYLSLDDNGKGVEPSIHEKIFDPFYTEKQAQGGTGLGLSVSYSIVKAHDGKIACVSQKGKGAIFNISLPVQPGKKLIKVLIADDDHALQKLMYKVLLKEGHYHIEKAFNGTEALIKLGTYLPDLLILDLFMPQMNGLEVCKTIVKEEKLSKMEVIIITGSPQSNELQMIKDIGFKHIFTKPFDIKKFVKDIERIVT